MKNLKWGILVFLLISLVGIPSAWASRPVISTECAYACTKKAGCPAYYRARRGSRLSTAPRRHYAPARALKRANALRMPRRMYQGQRLCVPKYYPSRPRTRPLAPPPNGGQTPNPPNGSQPSNGGGPSGGGGQPTSPPP
jgi:hypothetical protein